MLTFMREHLFLPEQLITLLLLGAADGLSHMHGKGFMHGDIKLENILVFIVKGANIEPFKCDKAKNL